MSLVVPKSLQETPGFGKYKSKAIRDLVTDDPGYLRWCVEQGLLRLDQRAKTCLEMELTRRGQYRRKKELKVDEQDEEPELDFRD